MYPDVKSELDYRNHFELLIAVVLSAQTTDVSVNRVSPELFSKYPDAKALSEAKFEDVWEIIKTIGLANTKARNIISLSKKLVTEKNGRVPADFDYLLTLPESEKNRQRRFGRSIWNRPFPWTPMSSGFPTASP